MRPIRSAAAVLVSAVTAAAMLLPVLPARAQEGSVPSGIAYSDIGSAIEKFAEDKDYASFETSVFCGDEILYTGYFGDADRENGIPADEETVYEWGSVTKLLVWVSVMQLYEKGILDLERDIRDYLPEGFLSKLRYDEPITMLDLMNHRAGFQETMYEIQDPDESAIRPLDAALRYTQPAQAFEPDTVTAYSNWSAALAGYIVQNISGETFSDYVHAHIFTPLGMEHTSIAPDYNDVPWVRTQREKLHSYIILEAYGQKINQPMDTNMVYIHLYPAGSAAGTLADLTRFAQALADVNSPLFQDPATHREMLTATSTYGEGMVPRNCHGLWTQPGRGVLTLGHGGNTNSCSAQLEFDPVSGTGVVVMTNQYGESTFCAGIPELVFGTVEMPEEALPDPGSIAGLYVTSRTDFCGEMKLMSCLSGLLPLTEQSDGAYSALGLAQARSIGGGMYVLEQDGAVTVCGYTDAPRRAVQLAYMDSVRDPGAVPKLLLLTAYLLMGCIGLVWLIVVGIRRLLKKGRSYSGKGMLLAGQGARCVSAAGCLGLVLVYAMTQAGMTHAVTALFGALQIVCLLVLLAAAVFGVLNLMRRREDSAGASRYVLSLAANAVSIAAILYFELCVFWI
ncbi:MAG: beta-lactamase family protein [Oscillospiraceae bacterium]|nr:beta-lactamase family protein [Oscillospiraceae bacterium]